MMNIPQLINSSLKGEKLAKEINSLSPSLKKLAAENPLLKNRLGSAAINLDEVATSTAEAATNSAPSVVKAATNEGATSGQSLGGVLIKADNNQKPLRERAREAQVAAAEAAEGPIYRDLDVHSRNPKEEADIALYEDVQEQNRRIVNRKRERGEFAESFPEKEKRRQMETEDKDRRKLMEGLNFDPYRPVGKDEYDLMNQIGSQPSHYSNKLSEIDTKIDNFEGMETLSVDQFKRHQELYTERNQLVEELSRDYEAFNEAGGFFTPQEIEEMKTSLYRRNPFETKPEELKEAVKPIEIPAPAPTPPENLGFIGRYAPDDASANVEMGGPIFGSIEAGGLLGYGQAMGMGALVGGAASLATGGEFSEGAVMGGIAGGAIRGVNAAIRANGSSLENMLYKNVFKDAPIPEGQAARVQAMRNMKEDDLGFVQKQARAMLMSENASLTTQSRGAIMAGAGLTGMMFTSPRKDKRRGFNKHRGNRI